MVIRGGASLVRYPPAFSNDGKRLLVCKASSVQVFSTITTLPVLQLSGHTDTVTSVSVVSEAACGNVTANHAWTSSLDGTIRYWDFGNAGSAIRTVNTGWPIESMVIPSLLKPPGKPKTKAHDTIAFLSVRWSKENGKVADASWTGRIIAFNLSTGKQIPGFLAKTVAPRPLTLSPSGNLLGMTDKRKIWIWRLPLRALESLNSIEGTVLHHTKSCVALSFNPTETVVAVGDETGRILCWHNVGERIFGVSAKKNRDQAVKLAASVNADGKGGVRGDDDAAACTTYHWHADEVRCLLFSADGTYLFSGGVESTLVIWQPETGKQQYFPRLGGQMAFMTRSSDPSVYAISCLDNTIKFVNIGTMTLDKSIVGIKPLVLLPRSLKHVRNTKAAYEPKSGKLVLPTENASLQFYDVIRDHHISEMQTAPRTIIAMESNQSKGTSPDYKGTKHTSGPSTFVTHVTFSADGSVMATVDMCLPEDSVGGGSCLRFWDREARRLEFVLNTVADEPHGSEIAALVYHPTEHMLVSCSVDGSFRVWVQAAKFRKDDEPLNTSGWRCRSVGSYRHKKMLGGAFSPDGSLLAVAAEELVTLWNPYSNGFLSSLAPVPSPQAITHLAFVPNSKFLVAASVGAKPRLTVWHLPSLSIQWSSFVHVEALVVNPNSSQFAIIALPPSSKKEKSEKENGHSEDATKKKAVVALFNAEDPTPTAAWSIRGGVGGSLFFHSSNPLSSVETHTDSLKSSKDSPQSWMTVLTGSREYVILNPFDQDMGTDEVPQYEIPSTEQAPSGYLAMYGNAASQRTKSYQDVVGIRGIRPWGDLLSAPSHVLPSLTKISFAFMESLLQKQTDIEKQTLSVI